MTQPIKIVMLGGGAVGKSAITVQQVSGHFVAIYDPTIEDSYRTSISLDGNVISIDILDTAGQDEYSSLRDSYIRSGDGYCLVYSITSEASFLDANSIREQIFRILDKDVSEHIPILLAGNKCDLENERRIKKEDAERIAKEWKVHYLECSAKNKQNISRIFEILAKDILTSTKKEENKMEEQSSTNETISHKKKIFSKGKCTLF